MATNIAIQDQLSHDATTLVYTAGDAAGMEFLNDGNTVLVVKAGATPTTYTVSGITDDNRRTGNTAVLHHWRSLILAF